MQELLFQNKNKKKLNKNIKLRCGRKHGAVGDKFSRQDLFVSSHYIVIRNMKHFSRRRNIECLQYKSIDLHTQRR